MTTYPLDTFIASNTKLTKYGLYGSSIGSNGYLALICDTTITISKDDLDERSAEISYLGNIFNEEGRNLLEQYITIYTGDILILDELSKNPEYAIFYLNHYSDLIRVISKSILKGELLLKKE